MWRKSKYPLTACLVFAFIAASAATLLSTRVHAQQSVGATVGDTVLEVSGQTSPNAYLSLYNDDGLIGTFTSGPDGIFNQSFPAQTPGITRLNISSRDSSNKMTDPASLEVNLQQHFPTAVYFFLPTTLQIDTAILTDNQPIRLSGHTTPDGTVTIYIDGQARGSVGAAADGTWDFSLDSSSFGVGPHAVFARVSDISGNQSFPTRTQTITVVRAVALPLPIAPSVGIPFNPRLSPEVPQILAPSNKQSFTQSRISLSGQGVPQVQIEIWENSQTIGSVWTNSTGKWELPITTTPGEHKVRARACLDGRCSAFSNEVQFTYVPARAREAALRGLLKEHTFSTEIPAQNGVVILRLRIDEGDPPFQITVDWGDNKTETFSHRLRDIELKHAYKKIGSYTGRVLIQNNLGSQEIFFTTQVTTTADPKTEIVWRLAVLIAICLLACLALYRLGYLKIHLRKR